MPCALLGLAPDAPGGEHVVAHCFHRDPVAQIQVFGTCSSELETRYQLSSTN
jgi:hypothetical protein